MVSTLLKKVLRLAAMLGCTLPYLDWLQNQIVETIAGTQDIAAPLAFAVAVAPAMISALASFFLDDEPSAPWLRVVAKIGIFASIVMIPQTAGGMILVAFVPAKQTGLVIGCLPLSLLSAGLTIRQCLAFLRLRPGQMPKQEPQMSSKQGDTLAIVMGGFFAATVAALLATQEHLRDDTMLLATGSLSTIGFGFMALKKVRDEAARRALQGEAFRWHERTAKNATRLGCLVSATLAVWLAFQVKQSPDPRHPLYPCFVIAVAAFAALAPLLGRAIRRIRHASVFRATPMGLFQTLGEESVTWRWQDIKAIEEATGPGGVTFLRLWLAEPEMFLLPEGSGAGAIGQRIKGQILTNREHVGSDLAIYAARVEGSYPEFLAMVRARGQEAIVAQQG